MDSRTSERIATRKGIRVLLVDDEPDITTVLSRGLESRGYKVDTFNDPIQAAIHFKPNYYDFCILDIRMPEKTGFDLARDIWTTDDKTQVCFLTSFEIYANEARKIFNGLRSYCFIKKPKTPSALAEHIEDHWAC